MSDSGTIINEVKKVADAITRYSSLAQPDFLLDCYSNLDGFRAFSGDGNVRNYEAFKKICTDYYNSVGKQEVTTIQQTFNVIDENLVIVSWVGNIDAFYKNGDLMKLSNYGVTFVFRKFNNEWKVIHSHESSLPPEIIKASVDK